MPRIIPIACLLLLAAGDKVKWVRDYDVALAQAAASGKAVLCHLSVPVVTGEDGEGPPPSTGG